MQPLFQRLVRSYEAFHQIISEIVSLLVVGLFDTNMSQSPCLMDDPSSQLDPYTPPNDYHIFYIVYIPSQQTKS